MTTLPHFTIHNDNNNGNKNGPALSFKSNRQEQKVSLPSPKRLNTVSNYWKLEQWKNKTMAAILQQFTIMEIIQRLK